MCEHPPIRVRPNSRTSEGSNQELHRRGASTLAATVASLALVACGDFPGPEKDASSGVAESSEKSCWSRPDRVATLDLGGGTVRPLAWDDCVRLCPEGSYVYGFKLKGQTNQGSGDDRAVTGIQMQCKDYSSGEPTGWMQDLSVNVGSWVSPHVTSAHPLVGGNLKYDVSGTDKKGATNLRGYYASDGDLVTLTGNVQTGMNTGDWLRAPGIIPEFLCPTNSAVCGFNNSIEADFQTDKVGVDEVHLECCAIDW
jgi:hypothetical protein